jgi:hypothetical protein
MSNTTLPAAVGARLEPGVGRLVPERAGFLEQIEACRREVAQWPEWMRQERTVPAWMTNHSTDL